MIEQLKNTQQQAATLTRLLQKARQDRKELYIVAVQQADRFLKPFREFIVNNPELYDKDFVDSAKANLAYPSKVDGMSFKEDRPASLVFSHTYTYTDQWEGGHTHTVTNTILVPKVFIENPEQYALDRKQYLAAKAKAKELKEKTKEEQKVALEVEELEKRLKELKNAKS